MPARLGLLTCVTVCLWLPAPALAGPPDASPGYHILKKYELGGEGRWDYLTFDPATRRLYITRQTHVIVLDADTGEVVGEIADTPGVHGVALAPELNRGFTTDGRSASATIFDLKTLKPLGSVKTGDDPDAILFDPSTKRVFTFNGEGGSATAFDPLTAKVLGTIDLGGKPEFAVSDAAGHLYANLEDKSEVVQLDPRELKVTARWTLAPGEEPTGLALDAKNRRLFSCCQNKLMVVLDADSGKVVATLPIGEGVDATRYDAETGYVFASAGEGKLTIIHEDDRAHFRVVQTVATLPGARTMTLDPTTHIVFTVTARFEPEPEAQVVGAHARPILVPDSFMVLVIGR